MTKLVVFDVDGTMIDSIIVFEKFIAEYSRANGLQDPCLQSMRKGYHDPLNHDFKWGLEPVDQRRHLHAAWQAMDVASLAGHVDYMPTLFHGVEEALRRLKDEGHTLAIVTARTEETLLHILQYHDIWRLFSAHRAQEDRDRRKEKEKPAPDMLQSVMRELDFAPEETAMIGDTTMDIHMGLAAGTKTIGVAWGAHPHELLVEAGAHHIVHDSFIDVVPVVRTLLA